jgi:hypothetical protein
VAPPELAQQPHGGLLLGAVAVGLLAHAFYRFRAGALPPHLASASRLSEVTIADGRTLPSTGGSNPDVLRLERERTSERLAVRRPR